MAVTSSSNRRGGSEKMVGRPTVNRGPKTPNLARRPGYRRKHALHFDSHQTLALIRRVSISVSSNKKNPDEHPKVVKTTMPLLELVRDAWRTCSGHGRKRPSDHIDALTMTRYHSML